MRLWVVKSLRVETLYGVLHFDFYTSLYSYPVLYLFIYFLWLTIPSVQHDMSFRKTNSIEHAHVRNADYNPKKQHILVSTGGQMLLFVKLSLLKFVRIQLLSM